MGAAFRYIRRKSNEQRTENDERGILASDR